MGDAATTRVTYIDMEVASQCPTVSYPLKMYRDRFWLLLKYFLIIKVLILLASLMLKEWWVKILLDLCFKIVFIKSPKGVL